MEHKRSIQLRTGPDQRINTLVKLSILLGVFAFLASPASPLIILIGCALCLTTGLWIYKRQERRVGLILLLKPDGRASWLDHHEITHQANLCTNAWVTSFYIVICVKNGKTRTRFLICRSHQDPDQFRICLSWLQLKLPDATLTSQA